MSIELCPDKQSCILPETHVLILNHIEVSNQLTLVLWILNEKNKSQTSCTVVGIKPGVAQL